MDGAAVEQIAGLTKKPMELGGYLFRPNDWTVEDPAALVKPGPTPKPLAVASLGALRDYVKANRDELALDTLIVHVASPGLVTIGGPLTVRARTREVYLNALALDLTEGFLGAFMSLEAFIIGLQVRFVDADERPRLLGLLSNVKSERVTTALDDGMTQVVQARGGVVLIQDVAVPNPVHLCPYRTFRDILQPTSPFVLRVKEGKPGGLPEVGLFEADGGLWRLRAIERVRDWLTEQLPAGVAVLA
jgi:hypothetical protein